jgi:hypothetical protein
LNNKIAKTHIRWAIKHIAKEGDTDIISTPFEHRLTRKNKDEVISALSNVDISSHEWKDIRRFVAQKDAVSFRRVCQLDPIDAILFSALISQNKTKLNNYLSNYRANSYSHNLVCNSDGEMYERGDGWARFWQDSIQKASDQSCNYVVVTDLVDYYNQIYHHTIENQLLEAGISKPHQTALKRLLQFETDKISRGIPVGPHPSHVLAELAMAPIDGFLIQSGISYCRYVDDFHIFVESRSDATIELSRLVQALDGHKLSLNRSKTRILPANDFVCEAHRKASNDPINSIESRFLELLSEQSDDPYDEVEIDDLEEEVREELYGLALDDVLSEYLNADHIDYVRIGWFLRRLSQVGIPGSAEFVVSHMDELLPVIADVAKYLSRIDVDSTESSRLGEILALSLKNDVIANSEYLSACVLTSFVNSPEFNNFSDFERLYSGNPLVKRKVVLVAEAQDKTDWIRRLKHDFPSADIWLKRAIIYACGKLPKDESETYIKHVKRSYANDLLFKIVANEALKSSR